MKKETKKIKGKLEESFIIDCLYCQKEFEWVKPRFKKVWLNDERNRQIWEWMERIYEEEGKLNLVLLGYRCKDLALALVRNVTEYSTTGEYIRIYFKELKKRYMEQQKKITLIEGQEMKLPEVVEKLKKLQQPDETQESFENILIKKVSEIENQRGKSLEFPTGIDWIDRKVAMERGNLVFIGGDTGSGKTSLLLSLVYLWGIMGKRMLFNLGEGGVIKRLIMMGSGVDVFAPNVFYLTKEQHERIRQSIKPIQKWDLFVREYYTPSDLLDGVLEINPDIIFIDYIQLMVAPYVRGNKVEITDEVVRRLRNITTQTKTLVISTSQFARNAVGKNTLPILSSFKNSSSIEQAGDICLLLYRKWLYDKSPEVDEELVNCYIGKNRNGKVGIGELQYRLKNLTFHSYPKEV